MKNCPAPSLTVLLTIFMSCSIPAKAADDFGMINAIANGTQSTADLQQYVKTPLLNAASIGDVEQVRKLLEAGAKPNDPHAISSPLYWAIMHRVGHTFSCNMPIIELLLKHGADPNRGELMLGQKPLLAAFGIGDLKCAETLRSAGAPAQTRGAGGTTILHESITAASNSGDMSIVDAALNWGINKDAQLDNGDTALHLAVSTRSVKIIKGLLNRGFNPCIKNKIDQTPLADAINLFQGRADVPEGPAVIETLTPATKNCK